MKAVSLAVVLAALPFTQAKELVVGPGGVSTIQECVDAADPGDTCLITGTYRETVTIRGGVTLKGQGEGAVLMGTEVVPDIWEPYKGNIYKTKEPLPEGMRGNPAAVQAFIDDVFIPEARWPNAQLGDMLSVDHWASAKYGTTYGLIFDPELNTTGVDWNGAIATINTDLRVLTYTRIVENYDPKTATFNYELPLPFEKNRTFSQYANSKYFLSGILAALDSPGEWFIDRDTWEMYVWMLDSKPPGERVSLRVRDLCVDATQDGKDHIVSLEKLKFHGCTFTINACYGCVVEDVDVEYPTYIREIGFLKNKPELMPNMTTVNGNLSALTRVSIKHTNLGGILLVGSHHLLQDSLVMDTDWLGTLDFPAVEIGFKLPLRSEEILELHKNPGTVEIPEIDVNLGGTCRTNKPFGVNNTVTRVTVRGFGNSGIVASQMASVVSYAHVMEGGLIGCDHAGIHVSNAETPCQRNASASNCTKEFHHNWVHDCREKCFRGDDATVNFTAHNIVAWNCGQPRRDPQCGRAAAGIAIKGNYNKLYDSTVFNVSEDAPGGAHGDLVVFTGLGPPPNGCSHQSCFGNMNGHSDFVNIAVHDLVTAPPNHPPVTMNSTQYHGGIVFLNRSALGLVDINAFNFTPTPSSPLYRSGVVHSPESSPVDGHNPSIGAVAPGQPWTPGCTAFPECS